MNTVNINPASTGDILVVDDNISDLKLLSGILREAGYKVRPASDGELALRSVRAKLPGLILLDINMPGLDGYEVCRRLKDSEDTRDIPVIFVSVRTSSLDKVKAFGVGGVDYISKPFEPEEVFARVATHLGLWKAQKEIEEKNLQLQQEIAGRKKREERIKHLNLVLRAIRNVNQLITREKDRDKLLQGTCNNLIETRGYYNAWIALFDKPGKLIKTAEAGLGEDFLPMLEHLKRGELTDCGRTALLQSDVVITEDPSSTCRDCPIAEKYTGRGAMTIRLGHEEKVYGLMSVSTPKDLAVYKEEQDLFREVAEDIAYALYNIEQEDKRKQAEAALRKSEERYRTVLETNPDPVVFYDIEGKVIYFNPAFTRVFGWTIEERISKKMDEFVPEEALEETNVMIDKVLAGESFSGVETRRFTKEGKIIPISISGAIYKDRDNNPIGSVINLRDISEQKTLENQLQQAQKMEAIGTLAGGIAHDFNNILFSLFGYTELALDDTEKGTPLHDNLQEVFSAAKRATDLVKQILTVGRQADHKLKPLSAQLVVREALKLIRASLPSTIEIKQYISNTCGLVMADASQIHQVAMNLLTNAFHAMEDEGGKLDVTLKEIDLDVDDLKDPAMVPGPYVCLTVSDTGTGIDKSVINRIFDPYFSTKEKDKGTGLGLSMVHGIVKSFKGNILVSSKPGKGTTFHVYLPVIQTWAEKKETQDISPVEMGTERILFVDDEEQIVRISQQMLEGLGYHVTARTSSIEALEAFRAAPDKFDLVITDTTMPNMTGVELAKKLMEIRSDIPIIICTGFSEKISADKTKDMGIRGFVMKPVVRSELARTIRKVLDGNEGNG